MCAKLRTVAASNNRDHARNLSYYCLLALHIYIGVILHAHPVRGESYNQRNTTGKVATLPLGKCAHVVLLYASQVLYARDSQTCSKYEPHIVKPRLHRAA